MASRIRVDTGEPAQSTPPTSAARKIKEPSFERCAPLKRARINAPPKKTQESRTTGIESMPNKQLDILSHTANPVRGICSKNRTNPITSPSAARRKPALSFSGIPGTHATKTARLSPSTKSLEVGASLPAPRLQAPRPPAVPGPGDERIGEVSPERPR